MKYLWLIFSVIMGCCLAHLGIKPDTFLYWIMLLSVATPTAAAMN